MDLTPVAGAPGDEPVEWLAEDGSVAGVVSRACMRAERRRHRAVFVTVVDSEDRVVVHRRAPWKDLWPDRWDLAFGGVVAVGESWEDAARRELAEETGLHDVLLEALGDPSSPFRFEDADVALVGMAFLVRTDREVLCADGEVVAVERVPRRALAGWAATVPVCPDSATCVLPLLSDPAGPTARRA